MIVEDRKLLDEGISEPLEGFTVTDTLCVMIVEDTCDACKKLVSDVNDSKILDSMEFWVVVAPASLDEYAMDDKEYPL